MRSIITGKIVVKITLHVDSVSRVLTDRLLLNIDEATNDVTSLIANTEMLNRSGVHFSYL